MKDWTKLNDEELAALTEEQVEFYKKLLYAENGVKILPQPKEPEDLIEKPDLTIYSIDGLEGMYSSNSYLKFTNYEDAKRVLDLLMNCKSLGYQAYNSSCGYDKMYFQSGSRGTLSISTTIVYSKEKYLEMQTQMSVLQNLKKQYEKDKKEYDTNQSLAIKVTEEFMEKLNDAKNKIERRQLLCTKFYNDYLPIAENNYDVAMNFLKKAYEISKDDENYINEHKLSQEE
jgi:hypothetical protein